MADTTGPVATEDSPTVDEIVDLIARIDGLAERNARSLRELDASIERSARACAEIGALLAEVRR